MSVPKPYASLAEYLKATSQTQEQFAEAISKKCGRKVSQGTVSMYVSGQQMPRPKLALLISKMTGVSVEAMLNANAKFYAQRQEGVAP